MKDYLLFIDTEASGLPKNWSLPYAAEGNWPCCVQIAWAIYTIDGNKIKEENHYVKNGGFTIEPSATKVHGITRAFLSDKGEDRKHILTLLAEDMKKYDGVLVGHFMQFDLHMLAADFLREALENPIKKEQTFCTMLASKHLIRNPAIKFLRLEQLYKILFDDTLLNHHNAIVDATATAACFFELVKRGDITDEIILEQQREVSKKDQVAETEGCFFVMLFIISMTALIYFV